MVDIGHLYYLYSAYSKALSAKVELAANVND